MEHFEFDPEKSRLNEARHGVSLAWAQLLWDHTHVIISAKKVSSESRQMILARVNDKCFAAVFTKRSEAIRLISCHRADKQLERTYESQIGS